MTMAGLKGRTALLLLRHSYWSLSAGSYTEGGRRGRYGRFGGRKQRAALQASLTEGMKQLLRGVCGRTVSAREELGLMEALITHQERCSHG